MIFFFFFRKFLILVCSSSQHEMRLNVLPDDVGEKRERSNESRKTMDGSGREWEVGGKRWLLAKEREFFLCGFAAVVGPDGDGHILARGKLSSSLYYSVCGDGGLYIVTPIDL